jgi:hypothetical protein
MHPGDLPPHHTHNTQPLSPHNLPHHTRHQPTTQIPTEELAAAEPAMKAAAAAVDVLSKPMLTELKNLKVGCCNMTRVDVRGGRMRLLMICVAVGGANRPHRQSRQRTHLDHPNRHTPTQPANYRAVAPRRRGLGDDRLPHPR